MRFPSSGLSLLLWIFLLGCSICNVQAADKPTALAASGRAFDETAKQIISKRCAKCHAVVLDDQCLAGDCLKQRTRHITNRAWNLVIPWMRSMGSEITESEQEVLISYLMEKYGLQYPLDWEVTGTTENGWNTVALAVFRDQLYAGTEGNGSISRLDSIGSWTPVLQTDNTTVYGLINFKNMLYGITNTPNAEVWRSSDGKQWQRAAKLPDETGMTSLGIFKGQLYAGSNRGTIYRSSDGVNWKQTGDLLANLKSIFGNWVRFIIPYNNTLYVGIERHGIFRSKDGANWSPYWIVSGPLSASEGQPRGVRGATIFKGELYFGTTTGGEIWKIGTRGGAPVLVYRSDNQVDPVYIGSMQVFNDQLYASVGGRVIRTGDGKQWEELGKLSLTTLEAMAVMDNYLYVGSILPPNSWIYRTTGKKR